MKTKIHILTGILILSVTLLYAGDPLVISTKTSNKPNDISFSLTELAPVTPRIATFNDSELLPFSGISYLSTITLSDLISNLNDEMVFILPFESFFLLEFAPRTPEEAGFEDCEFETGSRMYTLAPVVPATAEFEE